MLPTTFHNTVPAGRYSLSHFDMALTMDSEEEKNKGKAMRPATGSAAAAGDVFRSLGSSVGLQILLDKPLLNNKKLQTLTKSVRDFIPHKPANPEFLQKKRAARALASYEAKVTTIVTRLAEKYSQLFHGDDRSDPEAQRKKLYYNLNESGAYFQLKEELKISVVEIVREHFCKKSPFATTAEMQRFLNEVYVFLMDKMHGVLNRVSPRDR